MDITHEMLSAAILQIRDRLVGSGEFPDYAEINRGYCAAFVDDVIEFLGGDIDTPTVDVLGVDQFMMPAADDRFNDGFPMNRGLLGTNWPGIQPTHGLTWDELDALSGAAGFTSGTHVFMHLDGRFYDSEAPDGVASFLELPFFERVVLGWIAEGKPSSDEDVPTFNMFAH